MMTYAQIRDSLRLTNRQAIELIQIRCPRFTKIQAAMIENPEYGVQLSDAAADFLLNADPSDLPHPTVAQKGGRILVNDSMINFMLSSKAKGYRAQDIADALGLSVTCVRNYLKKTKNHGKELPPLKYTGKWGYD